MMLLSLGKYFEQLFWMAKSCVELRFTQFWVIAICDDKHFTRWCSDAFEAGSHV